MNFLELLGTGLIVGWLVNAVFLVFVFVWVWFNWPGGGTT